MGRMNSAQLSLSRSRRASDRTDQLSTVHDSMNEAETHAELIDPAPRTAGCGVVEGRRIRPEVIAPGRLVGNGRRAPAEYADYIYRGHKLAVIEAKSSPLVASLATDDEHPLNMPTISIVVTNSPSSKPKSETPTPSVASAKPTSMPKSSKPALSTPPTATTFTRLRSGSLHSFKFCPWNLQCWLQCWLQSHRLPSDAISTNYLCQCPFRLAPVGFV